MRDQTDHERCVARQTRSLPVLAELRRWLDEGAKLPTPPPADNEDDFWRVDFYGNPLPRLHDQEARP